MYVLKRITPTTGRTRFTPTKEENKEGRSNRESNNNAKKLLN